MRLGHRAVEAIAATDGISVGALRMRLSRIDGRIAEALVSGLLTGVASPEALARLRSQAKQRRQRRAGRAVGARREAAQEPSRAAA